MEYKTYKILEKNPMIGGFPIGIILTAILFIGLAFILIFKNFIFSIIALVFGYVIISIQLKFKKEGQFIDFLNQKAQGSNDFTFNKPMKEILTQHKLKKQQ
jgi:type IV secretory pathway VirB3-like protein